NHDGPLEPAKGVSSITMRPGLPDRFFSPAPCATADQATISLRKAQRVMRFSTMAQTAYMATPMMAMAIGPANAVGASLRALADSIRKPMPLLPPTVAEITEPMKASVMATFRLANR